jgi:hypothetical protein
MNDEFVRTVFSRVLGRDATCVNRNIQNFFVLLFWHVEQSGLFEKVWLSIINLFL